MENNLLQRLGKEAQPVVMVFFSFTFSIPALTFNKSKPERQKGEEAVLCYTNKGFNLRV